MRKPDKDNPYLTHRFLHCFADGNVCQIVFNLKDNKVVATASWKTKEVNWELIEQEYLVWSTSISLAYEEILLETLGPFMLNPFDNSVELLNDEPGKENPDGK